MLSALSSTTSVIRGQHWKLFVRPNIISLPQSSLRNLSRMKYIKKCTYKKNVSTIWRTCI